MFSYWFGISETEDAMSACNGVAMVLIPFESKTGYCNNDQTMECKTADNLTPIC